MKYIIMCGGKYEEWETPRQLTKICGEEIVARTIRLLKENGVKDINISSNNPLFKKMGVPVLEHNNSYLAHDCSNLEGDWYDAFYPTDEPTCYIFGDVVFSPEAIKTIVETETDDIEFFGSTPPFACTYIKNHVEPFALKVVNTNHLKDAIEKTRVLDRQGKFWRKPIMWELWTVIKDVPLQTKPDEYIYNYVPINDYTCDVDRKEDAIKLEMIVGGDIMIKVEALITFTLARFNEIKNLKRNGQDEPGKLFPGDTFECDEELCGYLTGGNDKGIVAVRVLEITPAEKNKTTAYLKDIKEQNKNKITETKNIKPPKIVKKKKQA